MTQPNKASNDFTDEITALVKARTLISNPDFWLKGAPAQNHAREPVDRFGREACRFCLLAAVERAIRDTVNPDGERAKGKEFWINKAVKEALHMQTGLPDIITFNDTPQTTHAEIIGALDRTIDGFRAKHQPPQKKRR